jgi:hypothetical protein
LFVILVTKVLDFVWEQVLVPSTNLYILFFGCVFEGGGGKGKGKGKWAWGGGRWLGRQSSALEEKELLELGFGGNGKELVRKQIFGNCVRGK